MFQKALIFLSIIPFFFAVNATETNGANLYLTNTVLSVSAVILSVLLFRKKLMIEVSVFDFIIPSLLVYAFLQHAYKGLNMYYVTLYLSLLIYSVTFILYRNLNITNRLYAAKCFIYSVLALTILQYIKITLCLIKFEDITIYISNSFGNTGIFAIFLSLSCLLCYFSYLELSNSKFEKLLYIIIGLANIVLIIYLKSRTALLIVLLFAIINVLTFYLKPKKLNLNWLYFVVGILLLIVLSFSYKQSSSNGRLLIWKASLNMAKDYFPFGSGFNTFPSTYPYYQAEYFNNGKMTNHEILLADSTITAFNEPLQVFCELGLFGLFFLFFILWQIFRTDAAHIKSIKYATISIIFASLFYYVFHNTLLLLITLLMLALLFSNSKPMFLLKGAWVRLFLVFIIVASVNNFYVFYSKFQSIKRFERINKFGVVTIGEFEKLNRHLSDNPVFLYMYANELYNTNQPFKSLQKLKELEKYVIWYNSEMLAGDCYTKINEQDNAENHYKQAVGICPGKFTARHKLLGFYINSNNKSKALEIASDIVNLPEKVPSAITLAIKLEAESYLHTNK